GKWSSDSKSHVATMSSGDFRSNEKSLTISKAQNLKIEFIKDNGQKEVLKDKVSVIEGEIIDATTMSQKALISVLEKQITEAKEQDVLFSLHMKATMMKVSDPIIFGHAVRIFFKDLFQKYET